LSEWVSDVGPEAELPQFGEACQLLPRADNTTEIHVSAASTV